MRKLLVIVQDPNSRMDEPDFCETEVYWAIDRSRYDRWTWIEAYGREAKRIMRSYAAKGWIVKINTLL